MPKRNADLYLQDILESIDAIAEYTASIAREGFSEDRKLVDATVRRLEIVGEAAHQLPEEYRAAHPEIPWGSMIGMRNKIMHEYFGVDEAILWKTVQEDLPPLRSLIATLLPGRSSHTARAA